MTAQEEIALTIESVQDASKKVVDLACDLYDGFCVSVDLANPVVRDGFVYHLDCERGAPALDDLRGIGCALLDGNLAQSNGVVLGPEHPGLCCSYRSCDLEACPVALAACFCAYREHDQLGDIPVYDRRKEESRRLGRAAQAFREKWRDRVRDSDVALNLLSSPREDDFSGMLVVEDDSYRDDFIDDLARILVSLGKIEKGAVERMHMASLVDQVDSSGTRFSSTKDENLRPNHLYVLDRLQDFVDLQPMFNAQAKGYVIERLGHIVDDRYVLLVGTEAETTAFCAQNSRFLFTFDQHRIVLGGMGSDELYRNYLDCLEPDLRDQAQGDSRFEREFKQYVGFNGDWLPFKGRELAEFLAKHANSLKRLVLPRSRYQSSSLEEMLDSVIGLVQVKDTIRQLEHFAMFRKTALGSGREVPPANMHMLFMGNPGTGKTTVARIISTMLYKIGIIRQNKCVEVTSKDLVAGYVGQTDKRTNDVVMSALGGILFVDEAYSLSIGGESAGSTFGKEAIAELVKCMEDHKDDLIVIFAGYEKEMNEFLEVNPGLASRIGYTFRFEDYTTDELLELFRGKVTLAGFDYDRRSVDRELRDIFDYHRRFKNFGNGRFVEEVVQKAIIKHAARGSAQGDLEDDFTLVLEDIPSRQELFSITNWTARGAAELLEPLVGMKDLKGKVCEFERVVQFYEDARKVDLRLPEFNMHMIFTGNPGTGKTTVARIIASILYNVGAVPTNKFIEIEAKDLAAFQFASSQTSTERYLKDAMGGVLFIDEAYSLLYVNNGSEIIAQLVKAMEDHKGEFVVMFAGYRSEMREFVDRNPGLASRIGYTFHFDDYTTDELQEIFDIKTMRSGLRLGIGVRRATSEIFRYFHGVENFGNGRFVDKIIQEVIARHANRCTPDSIGEIVAEDVPSIEDVCKIVSMPVYEPSDVSDEEARRRVAIHEMGHAVCRLALTGGTDIMVVTIEQEGTGTLGYVQHKATTTALPTSEHLMNEVVGLMGGMAAEQLRFSDYSAGNSSDLQRATQIASRYVATYGMSSAGYVQYLGGEKGASVGIADLPSGVQAAINDVMGTAFQRAQDVIAEHHDVYHKMVDVLLEEGTISGERIVRIWQDMGGGEPRA
ncbi:MAG: AAA family ATPase [Acidobacteriota bacterium]|nr:AAA family ATPase [Acidobacteriota bacterium]